MAWMLIYVVDLVKLCKTTSAQNFMIDRFFLNDACRPQHVNLLYKSDKMERTSAV